VKRERQLVALQERLRACVECPEMIRPVVVGSPVASEVLLVGQAPGIHEGPLGRPFAWTAGKTLFKWFSSIGLDEERFRARVYMAAVCRCFPGKQGGADRPPSDEEVARCSRWLDEEVTLADVVGESFPATRAGRRFDAIPLPHPSGASTWFRREPGVTLLARALEKIAAHPSWQMLTLR
jgi:uracil-DNA glycosylase